MLVDALFMLVGHVWRPDATKVSHKCRGNLPSNLTRRVRNGGEICKAVI